MFNKEYERYKELIESHLLDFLPEIDTQSETLYESIKYSLTSGGNASGRYCFLPQANFVAVISIPPFHMPLLWSIYIPIH